MHRIARYLGLFVVLVYQSTTFRGQLSLSMVTDFALHNSAKARMAKDDVDRALLAVSEAKDVYIPNLGVNGGLGRTYGITLTVPTIFTISTQSLIYGPGQRDYIKEARDGLKASSLAYESVRQQIEEDTVLTCLAWVEGLTRRSVLAQQLQVANELVDITEQRRKAGLESEIELKRTRRTLLQVEVQQTGIEDELAVLRAHLESLSGLPAERLRAEVIAVPEDSSFRLLSSNNDAAESVSVRASEAYATSKNDHARGELRFLYRPQVLTESQFGRISPINNVSSYYNLNGHYNVSEFGIAIQLPLFDRVRLARAREAAVDAVHAQHETELSRSLQHEEDAHLASSAAATARKLELAELDLDIAKEQLETIQKQVETDSAEFTGGRQLNPKDALYAQIDERQHYYDWLEAQLQWRRAQIAQLRREGRLDEWLKQTASLSAAPISTRTK